MEFFGKFIVIVFFVLFLFSCVSCVSAQVYVVNETWDPFDIQFLIYSENITGLHFSKTGDGVYFGVELFINKAINLTCDTGVVLQSLGDDLGNAFFLNNVSDVSISGFTIEGYMRGIWAHSVSSVLIANNILNGNSEGVWISDSQNTDISNNIIKNGEFKGIIIHDSNNLTISYNIIENCTE